MAYSTEVNRRIYNDDYGVFIEVGPDADGLGGLVEVRTIDAESKKHYGELRLTIDPEMAKQLAFALLKAADEVSSV